MYARRVSAKTGILTGIVVYTGVTIWGYFLSSVTEIYILAGLIGLVQGGVQSLSRSLYARFIPKGMDGEFFGFYNMIGKFAAIVGPALMGLTAYLTKSTRFSILSVIILFIVGFVILYRINVQAGIDRAAEFKHSS